METHSIRASRWLVRNGAPRWIAETFDEHKIHRDHGKFSKEDVKAAPKTAQIRAGAIPEQSAQAGPSVDEWNAKFDQLAKLKGVDKWDMLDQIPTDVGRTEQMTWMDKQMREHASASGRDLHEERRILSRAHAKFRSFCDVASNGGRISHEQARHYSDQARIVLENMNRTCLERFGVNLENAVLYPSTKQLTEDIVGTGHDAVKAGKVLGGCWEYEPGSPKGTLHLDGGKDTGAQGSHLTKEFYAHEFAHAIDATPFRQEGQFRTGGGRLSDTPAWKEAYEAEINQDHEPLSKYARTDASEGFAEFGRLAWSGKRPSEIRAKFPKCWKVWETYGLVDGAPQKAAEGYWSPARNGAPRFVFENEEFERKHARDHGKFAEKPGSSGPAQKREPYKPAATIEEAHKHATEHLAESADFTGVDVHLANAINSALTAHLPHGVKIKAIAPDDMGEAMLATDWGIQSDDLGNFNYDGRPKLQDFVLSINTSNLTLQSLNDRVRAVNASEIKRTGRRRTVGDSAEDCVLHEIGHILSFSKCRVVARGSNIKLLGSPAQSLFDSIGSAAIRRDFSTLASEHPAEFAAELYVAYKRGKLRPGKLLDYAKGLEK